MHFDGCIESTPAVWKGWLYLGTREGYLYGITDAEPRRRRLRPVQRTPGNSVRYWAVRHAASPSAATVSATNPATAIAMRIDRCPHPSATTPAASPAKKPPRCAFQSISGKRERQDQVQDQERHDAAEPRGGERRAPVAVVVGDERSDDAEDRPRRADADLDR